MWHKTGVSAILCFSPSTNQNTGIPKTPEVAMRAKRTTQISLFDPQAIDHPVADDVSPKP